MAGAAAGIISGILSAVGGIAGAVGKGAHGPGGSALGPKTAGPAPYTPTAANVGMPGAGAPQAADLRLSEIMGQPRRRPEDEMTLGMITGY
jgi:hypothetical protein